MRGQFRRSPFGNLDHWPGEESNAPENLGWASDTLNPALAPLILVADRLAPLGATT
jgi:hypothetical protein